jgi:uncharacterized protein HemX
MNLWNQRGQTGTAVLALIVALIALGISVYTHLQVSQRVDMQTQITNMRELVERGRQEMADGLKQLEEQVRGSQAGQSPPKQ